MSKRISEGFDEIMKPILDKLEHIKTNEINGPVALNEHEITTDLILEQNILGMWSRKHWKQIKLSVNHKIYEH